ncbi:MAG TPA: lipoyl(octanoyl) transferase LipB [Solirubrobacteraceae bacterium]|nr:lipoyl(octanoyl) transferase LipB [Solirubrobacteraceae bacterium]
MIFADEPHEDDELWVCRLGTERYEPAVAMQERIRERRIANEVPDTLLLLEHEPVYTRGRRAAENELALGADFYRARGIDVIDTRRGGRVTYHAPGQLVGYAIARVEDVAAHLRRIETALIAALADLGVTARSRCAEGPDYTGVWVDERKIASIGVHVSRGVSAHGFAVNVDLDLDPFGWVIACGLPDVTMTSLRHELAAGSPVPAPGRVRDAVARRFAESWNERLVEVSREQIDPVLAGAPS